MEKRYSKLFLMDTRSTRSSSERKAKTEKITLSLLEL